MNLTPLFRRLGLVRAPVRETAKQRTGRQGEEAAATYLQREKGFRIIVRNWRHDRDEIDLVCWDGEVLVFVEVKTRAAGALMPGYFAVDRKKKEILLRVFGQYLKRLRKKPRTFRFDIVEVNVAEAAEPEIFHFENIPLFTKGYHWEV